MGQSKVMKLSLICVRLRRRVYFALISCLSALACTDLPRPPVPEAPANGVILVTASDFTSAFLSTVVVAENRVVRDVVPLYNDTILRYSSQDTATYAIQRLGSDALRRLSNAAGYTTVYERSLKAQSNPQDVAFLPDNRMAVSYYNRNEIAILDRQSGAQVATVDLSAFADSDGYAEIAGLAYVGGALYAAVQRLNRAATDAIWPPTGQSYLVKIHTTTYLPVKSTLLTHANPVSRLHYHAGRNSLVFAAPERYYANSALDGACLEYDLASDTLLTPPITEAEAGYEIADCQIYPDGTGVFVGNDLSLNSVLGVFNPVSKTVSQIAAQLSSTNGGYFSDFLLHSNGRLYLADRNIYRPGVRVFVKSGGVLSEYTANPLYTGLPPFVLEEVP
ncbi:MAG: hypothetical protein OHK0011_18920 [Turneriella sp.]